MNCDLCNKCFSNLNKEKSQHHLNKWICGDCTEDIYQFHKIHYQPERSKREDLDNGYFPPPWNFYEYPEKTEGWIEFQKAMRKDPEYYLGCGALNSMET
jgi:hypothetical protein